MGMSDQKPILRRQKGWKGFVQSYNKYVDEGSYDDIDWTKKAKPKSETKDIMGKTIIKF